MPRSIWKGAIAFGLVHVPVALYPASQEDDIEIEAFVNADKVTRGCARPRSPGT
jgi:non-homologous end joining protein Ku